LLALLAVLGSSQAFANETWTYRDEFADEDDYLIVDDRMIPKKADVVLTVFVDNADQMRAYNLSWTAHQPARPVYSFYLIERRSGFFRRWVSTDAESFKSRSKGMPGLLRLGSCMRAVNDSSPGARD
jgi:hypothetical protein